MCLFMELCLCAAMEAGGLVSVGKNVGQKHPFSYAVSVYPLPPTTTTIPIPPPSFMDPILSPSLSLRLHVLGPTLN